MTCLSALGIRSRRRLETPLVRREHVSRWEHYLRGSPRRLKAGVTLSLAPEDAA